MASEKKTHLPDHIKVAFCKILDQAGGYSVVLRQLFPPEKTKKVHKLVFKYETKKCQLTMKQWQDFFVECRILREFYEVVKKYTGEDNNWILIEEKDEDDVGLPDFNDMHIAENPTGNHRDTNADCIKDMSPNSRDSYTNMSPNSKTIFKKGVAAGRRIECRKFKATGGEQTPSGSTINKAVFDYTPSTSGGEPGTTAPARRLFGDSEGTTRVPEQAAQLT